MSHYRNRDLYIERMTEADLIKDFPADERLIGGLHAMQAYFASNQSSISIPVVRIMNAAHLCCAYMFHTTCSGDQREYDALLYSTLGSDRQLMYVALITTAAMLKQTEGFRARACRSLILENRSEDFEEGVTLYERFLNSSAVHFSEDDFETDIMHELSDLRTRNQELIYENTQLKTTITIMEDKYQQIIGTQNNYHAPVYNNCTFNNNYVKDERMSGLADEKPTPDLVDEGVSGLVDEREKEEQACSLFCRITEEAKQKGKAQIVEAELHSACISAPKLISAIRTNEALGYLDTKNLSSVELYNLLNEHFHLPFKLRNFDTYRSK